MIFFVVTRTNQIARTRVLSANQIVACRLRFPMWFINLKEVALRPEPARKRQINRRGRNCCSQMTNCRTFCFKSSNLIPNCFCKLWKNWVILSTSSTSYRRNWLRRLWPTFAKKWFPSTSSRISWMLNCNDSSRGNKDSFFLNFNPTDHFILLLCIHVHCTVYCTGKRRELHPHTSVLCGFIIAFPFPLLSLRRPAFLLQAELQSIRSYFRVIFRPKRDTWHMAQQKQSSLACQWSSLRDTRWSSGWMYSPQARQV